MPQNQASLFDRIFIGNGITSPFLKFFKRAMSVVNYFLRSVTLWTVFVLLFKNNMPIVVVLSNSMAPDFVRGDLLLAISPPKGTMFPNGEVCAYNVPKETSTVPIVHRMIETHRSIYGDQILTKGDNNKVTDAMWLYDKQQFYDNAKVETELVAVIPFLGWPSIIEKENIYVNILFIIGLCIFLFRNPDA